MMRTVTVGDRRWSIEDVGAVARAEVEVTLSTAGAWRERIESGSALVARLLEDNLCIYGVTTGFGDSCSVTVPPELVRDLTINLVRFHGCGAGQILDVQSARAVMAARLKSLAAGFSGVRLELLERLCAHINLDVVPVIPAEGSVGASGDLTPLSYLAASLMGERDVYFRGARGGAKDVIAALGLEPLHLRAKESVALMNGTSMMTGLACLAFERAEYLARLAARITACAVAAAAGNRQHFDEHLHAAKPFPGQQQAAAWIRADLARTTFAPAQMQDRYSLRCAPHVIGVLLDALPWIRGIVECELNSSNDNPLIDGVRGAVYHGGHFYGGHIGLVMDTLKVAVASVADLLDRQLALLVDSTANQGLPRNLSGAPATRRAVNHGFKAVQIAVSAWTAEALKGTMPATVFSRSTECHNQDKVSMGSIAARDCLRVLELSEQVAAASLLAVKQAVDLRALAGGLDPATLDGGVTALLDAVAERFEFLAEDRPLEGEIHAVLADLRQRRWDLYSAGASATEREPRR